jgi:hypothetical protein
VPKQPLGAASIEPCVAKQRRERRPRREVEDETEHVTLQILEQAVAADERRMLEAREGAGLTPEPVEIDVARAGHAHDLQRDVRLRAEAVDRAPHGALPAFAEPLDEAIAIEQLARREIHGSSG